VEHQSRSAKLRRLSLDRAVHVRARRRVKLLDRTAPATPARGIDGLHINALDGPHVPSPSPPACAARRKPWAERSRAHSGGSITSKWLQSAPAAITSRTYSPGARSPRKECWDRCYRVVTAWSTHSRFTQVVPLLPNLPPAPPGLTNRRRAPLSRAIESAGRASRLAYTITLLNSGHHGPAIARHWIVTDANGTSKNCAASRSSPSAMLTHGRDLRVPSWTRLDPPHGRSAQPLLQTEDARRSTHRCTSFGLTLASALH